MWNNRKTQLLYITDALRSETTIVTNFELQAHISRGGSSRGAAVFTKKCKVKDPAKFAWSLDLVTKFHNTIIFSTSDSILGQRFFGIQQNNVSLLSSDAAYGMTFSAHIWRFRGCLRHSPKRKKPSNWLQKIWWYIRLLQGVFVILTMTFSRKNGNVILTGFYYLNLLNIEFLKLDLNNVVTSTLAILAAMDLNLVANLGLRHYSPCLSAPLQLATISWWAV